MLIKQLYTIGDPVRALIELPDGTFATFLLACGHKLGEADLTRSASPLPREIYLAAMHAQEYDSPELRALQMRTFGLTTSPIVQARWDAGLTQQELADRSGVNIRQIQKAESGETDPAKMAAGNLLSIADVLGVDPRTLI